MNNFKTKPLCQSVVKAARGRVGARVFKQIARNFFGLAVEKDWQGSYRIFYDKVFLGSITGKPRAGLSPRKGSGI